MPGIIPVVSLALALLPTFAFSLNFQRDLNEPLLPSYDYIVVGCGISGLVVTNRLSEDPTVSVLCIEAGIPDQYEEFVLVPQFVGSDVGGVYDWNLATVPQTYLDGAQRPMPQGKALGGGSILNAMCWNRGGINDYNAWEELGNPGWNWDGLLPYFMKSETYTPVYSEEIADAFSIHYNPAVHGTSGPVQVSYPKYFYDQSINFFDALNLLGVPTAYDPNDGTSAGASFIPTDLDPKNQTRSDARITYYDPYVSRRNYHVITGQHVTRVLIDNYNGSAVVNAPTNGGDSNGDGPGSTPPGGGLFGNDSTTPPPPSDAPPTRTKLAARDYGKGLRISGVEFAPNASAPRQTAYATREVIIAAGSLHSAQLLQLSGIGPSALLKSFNISLAIDLPGVGNNLQDHYLVGTFYPYNNLTSNPAELTTNATYNAEAEQEYYSMKDGPWTAGSPNGLAFPSLPSISNMSSSIIGSASSQDPSEYLVNDIDPTVLAGYAAQKKALVGLLSNNDVAAYEIINNNEGSLTVAVMHPLSRGTCQISSPDPFQPPLIDPRYGSNPVDLQILSEALKFNRRILATPPMMELQPAQFVPPMNADDDALMQVIKNGIRTEYHPSGTCAMLPLERGGVVDSHLRVWGTQNLRVVDAGIIPLIPAAHLQATVYAVAEKAADILKEDNVGVSPSPVPLPSSSGISSSATASISFSSTDSDSTNFSSWAFTLSSTLSRSSNNPFTSSEPSLKTTRSAISSSSSLAGSSTSALPTLTSTNIISSDYDYPTVIRTLSTVQGLSAEFSTIPVTITVVGSSNGISTIPAPTPTSSDSDQQYSMDIPWATAAGGNNYWQYQNRLAIDKFNEWLENYLGMHI
ncbi:MAG: hypothetical protein M1827_002237 [Pycnora praestabilis]|nr:MAG: hypothetical protein M1827_002237 [Pycnora praestabilis]